MGCMLNSATGTPTAASRGAYIATGFTTDEVPTTRHKSHFLKADSEKLFQNYTYGIKIISG